MKHMFTGSWMAAVLMLLALSASAEQQAGLRQQLFAEADSARQAARDVQAEVLAPDNYARAMRLYQSAEENFERKKSIEKISKDLAEAVQYFRRATKASSLAEVTFPSIIQSRNAAIKAEAASYAPELWEDAEKRFAGAAGKLEDGNVNAARKRGEIAEKEFLNAELIAIKNRYLTDTRELLAKAEEVRVEKLVPMTLQSGRDLLAKAEQVLDKDRYDIRDAMEFTRQANYALEHALYLNEVLLPVKEGDVSLEEFALRTEEPLAQIGVALDMVLAFDSGLDAPTNLIINQIKGLRNDSQALSVSREEVLNLEDEVRALQKRLGDQSDRISRQEEIRQKFAQVESTFTDSESLVYRQGSNVLLRLVGLNFNSGEASIQPQYFSLLSKVMHAIRLFPGASLVVEGHTDSFGSELLNSNLSQKRADAVAEYLKVNMRELSQTGIRAIGYGESRPVSNNETAEGRRTNRRIDLLIKPGF